MDSAWQYSALHNSPCKVIEEQTLWGQTVCRVWLPNQNAVVRVPHSALRPLDAEVQPEIEAGRIAYIAAAAKIAEVLEGSVQGQAGDHVLMAPMESSVIPLPHQLHVLSRVMSGSRMRYLLADEVGLGKTIEAGLVMREMKLRGLARRILVVAPKGLATQWVSEMQTHFNEQFHLIRGEDIAALHRVGSGMRQENSAWNVFDQIVVSHDSVKPVDKRRGWSAQRLAEYNRTRFEDLITAGWDLVVVDEAHRLGGSSDQVARYKLGKGLAEAAPYLLLLSATPHQGKSDAFLRLMQLLDDAAFPDVASISRERVAPYVLRTEKRSALDAHGQPLFKNRRTKTMNVAWEPRHRPQQLLYEAVTDYVRDGYTQALREKKRHIGFLMILMQRLVVSSTRAIRATLERRLEVLRLGEAHLNQYSELDDPDGLEDFFDLDGQEQLEELLKMRISALHDEYGQVETLLDAANRCEQAGPDAKAEALVDLIFRMQAEANDPEMKALIFTEFVPTQMMLADFLAEHGFSVVTLNGSMDMDQRREAQDSFRKKQRIMISTDAGGEGLNLQFCHVVVNYDIPWNPMRLEQRIGRVDRIGQYKIVQAVNLFFEESVELRVREVLEQKLALIFEELGIDKTGDVLDSAQVGELFEEMFAGVVARPDHVEEIVDQTVFRLREDLRGIQESSPLSGLAQQPDPRTAQQLRNHPLPYWVERMTTCYLNSHGGKAIRKRSWWELNWPDGSTDTKCVFSARDAERLREPVLVNLEQLRVRSLALNLPSLAPGQPLPVVSLPGLPASIAGHWGLFEVRLQIDMPMTSPSLRMPLIRKGFIPVFLNDEGRLFLPTARHIWDALQTTDPIVTDVLVHEDARHGFAVLMDAAIQAGKDVFDAMLRQHAGAIASEEERARTAFAARGKAIDRVGLPEVRQFRANQLRQDEEQWRKELEAARRTMPEMRALAMFRIRQEAL